MKLPAAFLAGVAVTVVLTAVLAADRLGLFPLRSVEVLELQTVDARFRLRGPVAPGPEVVLVQFDDKTMAEAPDLFGRRAGHARVVRALRAAGAAVIGIDMFYDTPEELLPTDLTADIAAWLVDGEVGAARALLERVAAAAGGDEALAEALRGEERDVVLAMHAGSRGNVPPDDRSLSRGRYGQVAAGDDLPVLSTKMVASAPMFNKRAARLGLVSTTQDVSGTVREIPLVQQVGQGGYFAPFSVQLIAQLEGVNRARVAYVGDDSSIHIADRVIRGENLRYRLNWRGEGSFPVVSVVDVVEGRAGDRLAGKIAILGVGHFGHDMVTTPFGVGPGSEVHATAVDNMLRGDPLGRAPIAVDVGLAGLVGLLVSMLFVTRVLGPGVQVVGSVVVLAGAWAVGIGAFSMGNLWIGLVGPTAVAVVATGTCLGVAYFREGLQRRFLRRTFAQYLSDELVEELVADPTRLQRRERREVTLLFSDIRQFTVFSERLEPEQLARFLNAYFEPMTRAVRANAGFVDKFMGDAVMAIFGAPVPRERHAAEACAAVLAMHAALDDVRVHARALGIDLDIGVGLNSGDAVIGNMGSRDKVEYTALGDVVNLASRIEGLTKRYGVFCLVGDPTMKAAGPAFQFRAVDLVRVKGKGEPVWIHELCGGPGRQVAAYAEMARWDAGIAAWVGGDLRGAREAFAAFAAKNPADPVVALFLARLQAVGDVAPEGWDGVFTHTEK